MRYLCLFTLLTFTSGHADVVQYPIDAEDSAVMEIDSSDSLSNILCEMRNHFNMPEGEQALFFVREEGTTPDIGQFFCINANDLDLAYNGSGGQRYPLQSNDCYRNYDAPVTNTEKDTIAYIVNMLADASYAKLLMNKGDLDRAGAKIDHLHPLRHLATVFSDEQLKISARNIRRKPKVWKGYTGGLGKSLSDEYSKNNISEANITDFAQTVQVDRAQIAALIQQQRWKDLIDFLADATPRQGNPRRYDM